MPTYVYRCNCCGLVVDVKVSVEERDNPLVCTHCYDFMFREKVSPIRFSLLGKDWYKGGYTG